MRALQKVARSVHVIAGLLLAIAAAAPSLQSQNSTRPRTPHYGFRIVKEFPHDTSAFTQGLTYLDGYLYEGTGLNGHSSIRKVQVETGDVVLQRDLSPEYFGEGITLFKDEVVQLTWQAGLAFTYDVKTFLPLRQFRYAGEGWGLTTDAHELFMSDGTDVIRVFDPVTFKETRRLNVHDGAIPIQQLNELEFVDGEIFANIWHSDQIARISPRTGAVLGWIDLGGLLSPVYRRNPEAVLNGIAYDSAAKRLFVTGKLWPRVFQIKINPK